jgi:hypothetical protein
VTAPDRPGDLAERQAALVAALVAGGEVPAGFDPGLVRVAAHALVHKRAGEVAATWPALRAALGARWAATFEAWAAGRPPNGALRDGWDLARALATGPLDLAIAPREVATPRPGGFAGPGGLTRAAAVELATREVSWRYDGHQPPRRRRAPALRRAGGALVVQCLGRVAVIGGRH